MNRRGVIGLVAVLAAVAIAAGALLITDSHDTDRGRTIVRPGTAGSSTTVTTLVPSDATQIAASEVTEFPGRAGRGPLAVGDGAVWAMDPDPPPCVGTRFCSWLLRIDQTTGDVVARVQVSKIALGLAVDESGVWAVTDVPDGSPAVVTHVDPATNRVVSDTDIPGSSVVGNTSPPGVAVGAGSVWAYFGRTLVRIDPVTGTVVATIDLPTAPDKGSAPGESMVANDHGVWINGSSAIWHVDPSTNAVGTLVELQPGFVQSMALDGDVLWLTQAHNSADGSPGAVQDLIRVDARTGDTTATRIRTCHVASGSGQLWFQGNCTLTISTEHPGVLAQLDSGTRRVVRFAEIGADALDPPTIAVAADAVWLLDGIRLTRVRTAP